MANVWWRPIRGDAVGTNAVRSRSMGRILDVLIVLLVLAWLLGWIFSVVVGLLIHVLLLFAVIAIGLRIYWWWKQRRERRRSAIPDRRS